MKKLLLLLLLTSNLVWAGTYTMPWTTESDDVVVTVGYGAGGANTIIRTFVSDADTAGRLKFIVLERPGANGSIALKTYFEKPQTNKSILGTSGGQVLFEALVHPENNFIDRLKVIGPVITSPLAIAVRPDSKFKSIGDLFDKKIPRQSINIAVGGESHEMLVKQIAKYSHHDIQAIRYKGGNEELMALLSGQVDMVSDAYGSLNLRGSQVRILGVAQPTGINGVPSITKYAPVPTLVNYFGITVSRDTKDIDLLVRSITVGFMKANRVNFYKEQDYNIDMNPKNDYIEREVEPTYNKWVKILDVSK